MPANTNPIFTITPNVNSVAITAQGASSGVKSNGDGTIGTDIFLLFTAGSNGSYLEKIRFQVVGSASATANATVLRIYLSSKSSSTTTGGTDTFNIGELAYPSVAVGSTTANVVFTEVFLNIVLKSGQTILVQSGNSFATNTSFQATAFGGDY
jgi:hypothetical protein